MNAESLLQAFLENHSSHPCDRRRLIEYIYSCHANSLPIDYKALEKLPPELNSYVFDAIPWIQETIDFLKEKHG